DWYFEPCVRWQRTVPAPYAGSIARSPPVRGDRAPKGSARDEAPPDTGKWRPTRRDKNRHRVPEPAPHRTSSLPGIRACGFGRPKCRPLQAKARCPFLSRRCERAADWAPLHDCKASQDGPSQSLPNTVDFVLAYHCRVTIQYVTPAPYFARLNRGKSCTLELLAE